MEVTSGWYWANCPLRAAIVFINNGQDGMPIVKEGQTIMTLLGFMQQEGHVKWAGPISWPKPNEWRDLP